MRRCQAQVMVLPGALAQCAAAAPALWQGACQCGHPREAWLCGAHAGQLAEAGCLACLAGERPHDCHVGLAATRQPEMN